MNGRGRIDPVMDSPITGGLEVLEIPRITGVIPGTLSQDPEAAPNLLRADGVSPELSRKRGTFGLESKIP